MKRMNPVKNSSSKENRTFLRKLGFTKRKDRNGNSILYRSSIFLSREIVIFRL